MVNRLSRLEMETLYDVPSSTGMVAAVGGSHSRCALHCKRPRRACRGAAIPESGIAITELERCKPAYHLGTRIPRSGWQKRDERTAAQIILFHGPKLPCNAARRGHDRIARSVWSARPSRAFIVLCLVVGNP